MEFHYFFVIFVICIREISIKFKFSNFFNFTMLQYSLHWLTAQLLLTLQAVFIHCSKPLRNQRQSNVETETKTNFSKPKPNPKPKFSNPKPKPRILKMSKPKPPKLSKPKPRFRSSLGRPPRKLPKVLKLF